MTLLNHTLKYFSLALLFLLGIWAIVFYYNMLDEVYDSLDDGLSNYKLLIIQKAQQDTTVLQKETFGESNYSIKPVNFEEALRIKETFRDTLMYMSHEKDFEPVRMLTTAFEAQERYYVLNIITSMVEEDDLISDLLYSLLWLYLAMLLSILLVNNFVLKSIWKPFYTLLNRLKEFRLENNKDISLPKTRIKEFKILGAVLQNLVQRNSAAYISQKQFIENASHELQTPLAISINKLEMLSERKNLSEEALNELSAVLDSLQRISRLNRSLLLLSKIENRQIEQEKEISVNKLIKELLLEFSDFIKYKNIEVSLNEESGLNFNMNAELAAIFFTNLIKNAIVHNVPDGKIEINIRKEYFQISNSGSALAADAEKIFTRFYKRETGNQNTGLGLAIVKAIGDLYSLQLEYSFDGKHHLLVKKQ